MMMMLIEHRLSRIPLWLNQWPFVHSLFICLVYLILNMYVLSPHNKLCILIILHSTNQMVAYFYWVTLIFFRIALFYFFRHIFTFIINRYVDTIGMILLLFSTIPVSKHKTFWVPWIFSVGPRAIHLCVLGFIFFVTSGSSLSSTYDPNTNLPCLLNYVWRTVSILFGKYSV